ncbi:MAG: PAS domain-containing protein, partial [Mariprofundaceae bacterium]
MAIITLGTLFSTLFSLYNTSFEQSRQRLSETVKSQAHLMDAVAKFDVVHSSEDVEGGAFFATIQQILDAHSRMHKAGLSEGFEFTLAKLENDQIVFIELAGQFHLGKLKKVPFRSTFAEPMRRALSGESGTIIALDYRGEEVLAAYEPLKLLGLGLVAKIDVKEIRDPFILAGGILTTVAMMLLLLGSLFFHRIGNPLVRKLQRSNREMEQLVAERTATLAAANEQLNNYMVELNTAQSIANLGSWHWDMVNNSERWSDQAFRNHGLDPETAAPSFELFLDFVHPDDKKIVLDAIEEANSNGSYDCEFRVVRPDQSVAYLHSQAKVTYDDNGKAIAMDGTAIDISDRKKAERELHESEQRLQSILDNTTTVIYLKDLEGKYLLTNNQWTKLFGISPEDMVGKTDYDVFPEEVANAFQKNDSKVLKENRVMEIEEYAPHDDGVHTYI